MIEVFKIAKHKYDYKVTPEFIYNINKVTTGNNFGLSNNRSHYDLRKFSFTTRIVNIWNSLPNAVCPKMLNIIILSTLASTGDLSEYDIESF